MRANVLLMVAGGTATVMAAAAPEVEFQQALPQLVGILKSFSFTGGGGSGEPGGGMAGGQGPALSYTRIQDSVQNAFTLEVPAGWRSQAQMVQLSVTDMRPEIISMAPSGDAAVYLGDRNVGGFMAPTQQMASLGFNEGMTTGGRLILRYLPGAQFGNWWLPRKFQGIRITGGRERADYAKQMMEGEYRYGNPNGGQMHSGEIDFEYQGQTGYALITTEVLPNQYATLWGAKQLIVVVGSPQKMPSAYEATGHMLGSIRYNPRWIMETQRITADAAQKQLAYIQHSSQLMQETLNYRWSIMDKQQRQRGDILRGQQRMVDPNTGEELTVTAGKNYYYRHQGWRVGDVVIGSDEYYKRGDFAIDVTELMRVE
jgi:hypothetical protein